MGLGASVLLSRVPACCRGSAVLCCYLLASGKDKILFVQAVRQPLRLGGNFWCFIAADFMPSSRCLSYHPCAKEGLTGLCPPPPPASTGCAQSSPGCPQPLPRGSNSPALSRDVEVRTPWHSFLSSVPLLLFYQYSSRSLNVNESSGLQIFSLSVMGIRYLPG